MIPMVAEDIEANNSYKHNVSHCHAPTCIEAVWERGEAEFPVMGRSKEQCNQQKTPGSRRLVNSGSKIIMRGFNAQGPVFELGCIQIVHSGYMRIVRHNIVHELAETGNLVPAGCTAGQNVA